MAGHNCTDNGAKDCEYTSERTSDKRLAKSLDDRPSWRNTLASYVAPTFELGYYNITRIRDVFADLARLRTTDEKEQPRQETRREFPRTVDDLLTCSSRDCKKISEMDYQYLRGCLDMLFALRKQEHTGEVPMPRKLQEILKSPQSESRSSSVDHGDPGSDRTRARSAHGNSQYSSSSDHPNDAAGQDSGAQPSLQRNGQTSASMPQTHFPPVSPTSNARYHTTGTSQVSHGAHHYGGTSQASHGARQSVGTSRSSHRAPQSGGTSHTSHRAHQSDGSSGSSWPGSWIVQKKQPRRIPITMVSNDINEITDGLLRAFVQSLSTAEIVYELSTVEPRQAAAAGQQQCIMGCVSASRIQSDINATLALFRGEKPQQLSVVIFHPKAPHVPLHVSTEQKLGSVPHVHAFIDIVFWDRQPYPCPVNEQAKAHFKRLVP